MPVGRLFFSIEADTSRLQQSVREAIAVAQDAGVKITRAGQSFVAAFDDALNPAKKLTEQIALLETVGRPASDILKVMGDQIRNASETARDNGQAIDPLVQKYVDLAAGAKSMGFSIESLGKSLGDFARDPVSTAKAGVSGFLDTLGPTAVGLAGIASAAAAAGAAVFKLAKDTADEAEQITNLSLRTGIGAERLQGLQKAAGLMGVSGETVVSAVSKINLELGRFYRSARRIKEKIDAFTIEEIHLLEEKCREKFPEHYAFVLCMARTGMRIGEVTALQWHDVDFANNYIVVRRNIPHHRQVETTKTEASQRKIDMSPELSAELMRLRAEKKKRALADGKPFDAEAWVFPGQDGTPIFYSNFLRRVWHKVQDQARVRRRTPHDLRHTWASHMLASGADLAYASNQLGHANPSITLRIYSHWVPGMRRVTTAVLDRRNAINLQMEAAGEEMEISGRP
jgi:integrase